ncbi:DUF943 family protein [Erwinia oleae]|uniref:DUF943 family protein n=1 Tax=Erwinia oleae TaxID=796334 RepID=UPI000554FBED|nr:DUF943 family protein [Erwinia oleae]
MSNFKKIVTITLIAVVAFFSVFFMYKYSQPTMIADVHKDGISSTVLVMNFPVTDKGKINWWNDNKAMLKEKFNIPVEKKDGSYIVFFHDFGKGYKEMPESVPRLSFETTDLRCFDDMKEKENCIEKDLIFLIHKSANGLIWYTTFDGYYKDEGDGKLIEISR